MQREHILVIKPSLFCAHDCFNPPHIIPSFRLSLAARRFSSTLLLLVISRATRSSSQTGRVVGYLVWTPQKSWIQRRNLTYICSISDVPFSATYLLLCCCHPLEYQPPSKFLRAI